MKKVTIKYESDRFLPENISDKFHEAHKNIVKVRYEDDKMFLVMSKLRGEIISWLANNGTIRD